MQCIVIIHLFLLSEMQKLHQTPVFGQLDILVWRLPPEEVAKS